MKQGVLFVCLGNICRSPMAEIVFRHMIKERGLEDKWFCDSAGTGAYHIGDSPDSRSLKTCKNNLKEIYESHRARQICTDDFSSENLANTQRVAPKGSTAVVKLLGEYDPEGKLIVEDPYYGGPEGFNINFQQVTRACDAILSKHST